LIEENKGKQTAIFLGTIFLVGYIVNMVGSLINGRGTPMEVLIGFDHLSILGIGVLFYLGYFFRSLIWAQPIVLFLLTPILMSGSESSSSFYPLGFFITAVLLLVRFGALDTHRLKRLALCLIYFLACEVFGWIRFRKDFSSIFSTLFFVLGFLLFLFTAFNDRIVVYLKEPKQKVSLEERGLADAEQLYVLQIISGKSIKEVSFENGVSESTIRNTLSRAYKKLGLHNKADLSKFAEHYDVVQ
jgi:DNA-binding CsgD family transcriptional regulator